MSSAKAQLQANYKCFTQHQITSNKKENVGWVALSLNPTKTYISGLTQNEDFHLDIV